MTPEEERKVLTHILDALDDATHDKWAWQASAMYGVAAVAIAAIAVWHLANPELVDASRVAALVATLFAGSMLGALSAWKLASQNSRYVCKFINGERVRARLAELAP